MPTQEITQDLIDGLTEVLSAWLPSATLAEIEEYYRNLPDNRDELLEAVSLPLIQQARTDRNLRLQDFIETDIFKVLPEPEVQAFVLSLGLYNAPSVIERYRSNHPDVTFSLKPAIDPGELAEWSRIYGAYWTNIFHLLTVGDYQQASVFLSSFIAQPPAGDLGDTILKARQLLAATGDHIEASNFEFTPLEENLVTEWEKVFEAFGFLPREFAASLFGKPLDDDAFQQLEALVNASVAHYGGTAEGLTTKEQLTAFLWTRLADERQERYYRLDPTITPRATDPAKEDLALRLYRLITVPFIRDSSRWHYLNDYMANLGSEDKYAFQELVKQVLRNSPTIKALFVEVDIDFFLSRLSQLHTKAERSAFIESLEAKVEAQDWPLVRQAMQMLATVF